MMGNRTRSRREPQIRRALRVQIYSGLRLRRRGLRLWGSDGLGTPVYTIPPQIMFY